MPPQPSDKMRSAERPTAGHAGSEACGEVVRPGGVCSCGTTRVRLPIVGALRGEDQAFSPGQPLLAHDVLAQQVIHFRALARLGQLERRDTSFVCRSRVSTSVDQSLRRAYLVCFLCSPIRPISMHSPK